MAHQNIQDEEGAFPSTGRTSHNFAERSSLYKEFLAEREEILKHKWLESEKRGEDIGFERALLDWIRKHRQNWRNARKVEMSSRK